MELGRPVSGANHLRRLRRAAQKGEAAGPERMDRLDAALREMVNSCPPSDRLISLVEQLDAGRPSRWH